MELDERIKEGKKPLGCFDLEVAKQFIGKKCFFGESLEYFSDLDVCSFGELKSIDEEESDAFLARYGENYDFIIPAEWVKENEKFEPFKYFVDLEKAGIKAGKVITFIAKDECNIHEVTQVKYDVVHDAVVTDIKYDVAGDLISITLGGLMYNFKELFQHYFLKIGDDFKPFGNLCSTLKPSESDNSDEDDEE